MKNAWGWAIPFVGFGLGVGAAGCDDIPGDRIVCEVDGLCFGLDGIFDGSDLPDGLDGLVSGAGVGESCAQTDCRDGLACNEQQLCEPAGTQGALQRCVIGPECADELQCFFGPCPLPGVEQCPVCLPSGEGNTGDPCQTDVDCVSGLKCALNGLSAECAPAGTVDLGNPCAEQTDCYQGLFCNEGSCSQEPPFFEGVECPEPNDAAVEALFYVPGASSTPAGADYFSFPFPHDFRLGADGRPDLGEFPTPGPGLVGFDLVKRYVNAIEAQAQGWSANPTIIFRFSGELDFDTLADVSDTDRRLFVVDVDNALTTNTDGDDDPATVQQERLRRLAYNYNYGGRTNYVCDDWLAIRMPTTALIPGHRYVAFMTTAVKAGNGADIARSAQFVATLADTPPSDPALSEAWNAHAPLRELIALSQGTAEELSADEVLSATVFTVGDVLSPMRALAAATAAAGVPQSSDWVQCGNGQTSPCPQASELEGRACGSGTNDYDEYQALVTVSNYQQGAAPYLEQGGRISVANPRDESVCISLSLPKTVAPVNGFPLVIFGHGTGGNYRSHLVDQVAGRLAREGIASLGFDQVQHGPRRGSGEGADEAPDNLFFNFLNPDAARGNPLQGAADFLAFLRWAQQGDLATAQDTGASAVSVDPTRVNFFGHSQGSTHSSMALPFSDLSGAVFSGNGGGLVEALLTKTNPVNIAGSIPYAIQDLDSTGQLRMGDKHPVLSLLQHFIDPADPVNFAPLLAARPEAGRSVKSVLQTFGLDDTFSPAATLERYFRAAELMRLAPHPAGLNPTGDNDLGVQPAAAAVTGNVIADAETATLVCRQYAGSTDGHFVVFENQEANDDAIAFLATLLDGSGAPTVPAP